MSLFTRKVTTRQERYDPLRYLFRRLLHAGGAGRGVMVRPGLWPGLLERIQEVLPEYPHPRRLHPTEYRPLPGKHVEEADWDSIEPGIAPICALINDSGIGETEFSCEGHVWDERGPDGYGEPYVLFAPYRFQTDRAAAMIPALMTVHGEGYNCRAEWCNLLGYARMTIRLEINIKYSYSDQSTEGQKARKAVMETARKHLERVLREALAPRQEAGPLMTGEERNRLLSILAEGCRIHPGYRAKRKPTVEHCDCCHRVWEAKKALDKLGEAGTSG